MLSKRIVIYKIEYLFDNNDAKNGNIHKIVVNETDTTIFTYNPMNQLTQITHPDTTTETLTYDDNGNLLSITDNSTGKAINYSWDCFNRLTGTTLPVRDGGQESVGFVWDGDNRLTRIEYPDGAVDMKQYGTDTYTTIETKTPVGMKTPTSRRFHHYNVLHYGQILCRYDHNGDSQSPVFYHYDHNSNLSIATDINGRIMEKPMTDAYGNPLPINPNASIAGSGSDSNPEKNQTKTLQQNLLTGGAGVLYLQRIRMYNMRRRFYNGLMRRFVSVDPLQSYSANQYNYVDNSPVKFSDPSGLFKLGDDTIDFLPWHRYLNLKIDVINKIFQMYDSNFNRFYCEFQRLCPKSQELGKKYRMYFVKIFEYSYTVDLDFYGKSLKATGYPFAMTPLDTSSTYFTAAFLSVLNDEKITLLLHEMGHSSLCKISNESDCDLLANNLGYNFFPSINKSLSQQVLYESQLLLQYWQGSNATLQTKYPNFVNGVNYVNKQFEKLNKGTI